VREEIYDMSEWVFDPAVVASFSDEKMSKVNLYESEKMFCDVYCLEPGQSQKPHAHAENDKIYYALTGSSHVLIGEDEILLEPGKLAVAPAGEPHGVENRSDERVTLLVVMAPHPRFS